MKHIKKTIFNHFNKKIYKLAFFALVFLLMLSPVLPEKFLAVMTFLQLNDKMEHFIAFFLLSFFLNRASSTILHRLRNVSVLLAFGLLIEFIQYFIPPRTTSLGDFLADAMGIFVFQALFSLYLYLTKKIKG